jgi:hypothetical protein
MARALRVDEIWLPGLPTLLESPTPLGGWLRGLMARMHKNAAVGPHRKRVGRQLIERKGKYRF